MKVFFKDVVLTDLEKFYGSNNDTDKLPLKSYAEAKGFDPDLFRKFMNELSNWSYAPSNEKDSDNVTVNELTSNLHDQQLLNKTHESKVRGNKRSLYFSLSDDDIQKYNSIIAYYTALSHFAFDYSDTLQYTEVFDIYWKYQPKRMPEDPYREDRFLYFPYLIEMSQKSNRSGEVRFLDIPERYKEEYYYAGIGKAHQKEIANGDYIEHIGDDQSYIFWKLIPVSKETPYEDALTPMTYNIDPIHNHLQNDIQWSSAIQGNLVGDGYANLTRSSRQGK